MKYRLMDVVGDRGSRSLEWGGWPDLWKALVLALVAGIGAALTSITEWVSGQDFGQWSNLIFIAWSTIVEIVRRWLVDFSSVVEVDLTNQPDEPRGE